MTIDEAIKHCKDIIKRNNDCKECIEQHAELLTWLEELKELRKFKTSILKVVCGD